MSNKLPLPLIVPLDGGMAVLPLGISRDDLDVLRRTIDLWEKRMVKEEVLDDYEI